MPPTPVLAPAWRWVASPGCPILRPTLSSLLQAAAIGQLTDWATRSFWTEQLDECRVVTTPCRRTRAAVIGRRLSIKANVVKSTDAIPYARTRNLRDARHLAANSAGRGSTSFGPCGMRIASDDPGLDGYLVILCQRREDADRR